MRGALGVEFLNKRGCPQPTTKRKQMTRTLHKQVRHVERMGEHSIEKKELPWLKHKWFLLKLWTGAYMLDSWEVVSVFAIPLAMIGLTAYYLLA